MLKILVTSKREAYTAEMTSPIRLAQKRCHKKLFEDMATCELDTSLVLEEIHKRGINILFLHPFDNLELSMHTINAIRSSNTEPKVWIVLWGARSQVQDEYLQKFFKSEYPEIRRLWILDKDILPDQLITQLEKYGLATEDHGESIKPEVNEEIEKEKKKSSRHSRVTFFRNLVGIAVGLIAIWQFVLKDIIDSGVNYELRYYLNSGDGGFELSLDTINDQTDLISDFELLLPDSVINKYNYLECKSSIDPKPFGHEEKCESKGDKIVSNFNYHAGIYKCSIHAEFIKYEIVKKGKLKKGSTIKLDYPYRVKYYEVKLFGSNVETVLLTSLSNSNSQYWSKVTDGHLELTSN